MVFKYKSSNNFSKEVTLMSVNKTNTAYVIRMYQKNALVAFESAY